MGADKDILRDLQTSHLVLLSESWHTANGSNDMLHEQTVSVYIVANRISVADEYVI